MPGIRKLWQYQQWAKPLTPPGQEQERTTPDKYHAPVDFPMAAWRKASTFSAAAVYPFFAVDAKQLTSPERTTPDKWMTDVEQPQFDVKRQQHLYPASVVDAKQLTLPERTSPDKWMPDTETPLFDVKRQQYDGPFFAPLDTKQLTLAERTTPDKWTPLPNLPRWDQARNQWLYPPFAVDPKQLTQAERTTPDKYQQPFEKPMWDLKRQQFLYPSFMPVDCYQLTQHENVLADKWHPDTETPLFDLKRWQFLDPNSFLHSSPITLGSVLSAEMFSYLPRALPPPLKNAPHLYPSFAIDPYQLTLGERITADKWHPEVQRPRWDVTRNQWLYPPFTVDGYQLTLGERITVDKWKGDRPDFIFRGPPYRPFAHYELPPEEIAATVDDLPWKYRDPDFAPGPQPARPHLYPSFSVDGKQLTLAERTTPDRWTPLPNLPVWDLKRQQFLYPAFTTDAYQLTLGERITVDKWFRETETPPRDGKRLQVLYPPFAVDAAQLTQPERTTLDKWAGNRPDYVFRVPPYRPFGHYEMPFEDAISSVEDLPWKIREPDFAPGPRPRTPHLYPFFAIDAKQLTAGERITLDKWFKELEKPLFDLKRQQQTYPFSFPYPLPLGTPPSFVLTATHQTPVPYFRQAPYRPFHAFEMPFEELLAVTDDVPWEFKDSFFPRRPNLRMPTLDLQVGQLLTPTPPSLDYFFQENSQFSFKNPPKRLTPEWFTTQLIPPFPPALDGWHFLSPLLSPARRPEPRSEQYRVTFTPPPAAIKMDWYFQDQLLAFRRKKVGNEAMPSLHYLFLVQLLGRIVALRTVAVSDLARIASVGLGDDMIRSSTVSDVTEAVTEGLADVQATLAEGLADDVTIQSLL